MCALAAPCPLPLAAHLLGREGAGALPRPGVGAAGGHGLTALRQPFYSMCLLRDLQSTYPVPGEWLGVNQAAHGMRKTVPASGGRVRASTEHAHSSWPCSPSIPRIRPIPAAARERLCSGLIPAGTLTLLSPLLEAPKQVRPPPSARSALYPSPGWTQPKQVHPWSGVRAGRLDQREPLTGWGLVSSSHLGGLLASGPPIMGIPPASSLSSARPWAGQPPCLCAHAAVPQGAPRTGH